MGLINILDIVEECSSPDSGQTLHGLLKARLATGERVTLSFKGVASVSTSFVNTALIDLLEDFPFSEIKSRLAFTNTNRLINDTIKRRFAFEVERQKQAVA